MNNIIEWMIGNKIAENNFSAAHIANGLKLAGLDQTEQENRCRLYRAWRPKSNKKDMLPTYQAYDLAIAGIGPADVRVRQIDFENAAADYLYPDTCRKCGGKEFYANEQQTCVRCGTRQRE